jgi:divalent metal cation (Fe/Co/Zn/Cd) transporter
MDAALPDKEVKKVENVLNGYKSEGIQFHALRTRQAGTRRFISIHILVPGQWSVQKGHEMLEKIESGIRAVFQDAVVFTHLEPIEDPISWDEDNPDR